MISLRTIAACSSLLLATAAPLFTAPSAYSQQAESADALVNRLIANATMEDQEVAQMATQIAALGQPGADALAKALETTDSDTGRLRLTYALGLLQSQAQIVDTEIRLSDATIERLVGLVENPPDPLIQQNAMLALSSVGSRATKAVPALLKRLGEEEDENARAGIQYSIARLAAGEAMPMLIEALRTTTNERLQGDIAIILQGQPLSDDVVALLVDILTKTTRDETREQIVIVLSRMKPMPPSARPALLTTLAKATEDRTRMTTASALAQTEEDKAETADALAGAAQKMEDSNDRINILRLMLAQGDPGVSKWARLAGEADTDALRSDLLRTAFAIRSSDATVERTIGSLIAIIGNSANEEIKKDAIFGLAHLGPEARKGIEQRRSQTQDMKLKESLSAALAIIASQQKKAP